MEILELSQEYEGVRWLYVKGWVDTKEFSKNAKDYYLQEYGDEIELEIEQTLARFVPDPESEYFLHRFLANQKPGRGAFKATIGEIISKK